MSPAIDPGPDLVPALTRPRSGPGGRRVPGPGAQPAGRAGGDRAAGAPRGATRHRAADRCTRPASATASTCTWRSRASRRRWPAGRSRPSSTTARRCRRFASCRRPLRRSTSRGSASRAVIIAVSGAAASRRSCSGTARPSGCGRSAPDACATSSAARTSSGCAARPSTWCSPGSGCVTRRARPGRPPPLAAGVPLERFAEHAAMALRAEGWVSRDRARRSGRPASADAALRSLQRTPDAPRAADVARGAWRPAVGARAAGRAGAAVAVRARRRRGDGRRARCSRRASAGSCAR